MLFDLMLVVWIVLLFDVMVGIGVRLFILRVMFVEFVFVVCM